MFISSDSDSEQELYSSETTKLGALIYTQDHKLLYGSINFNINMENLKAKLLGGDYYNDKGPIIPVPASYIDTTLKTLNGKLNSIYKSYKYTSSDTGAKIYLEPDKGSEDTHIIFLAPPQNVLGGDFVLIVGKDKIKIKPSNNYWTIIMFPRDFQVYWEPINKGELCVLIGSGSLVGVTHGRKHVLKPACCVFPDDFDIISDAEVLG